ncbi:hypothetical protein BMI91_16945 [Thioclava sediminum]|uniref:Uncharacterized protein n=1 Tax=Thioclava sediminum TaxID=1915319 RepID=A0ABX3MTV8_9RHOB|nr:hypothetical protein [Thioclava sediminum]OOY23130.1 hypothetical protein BMI91_16945 [Thioclava sediminum]
MSLKRRIEQLEHRAGSAATDGPTTILIRSVTRNEAGELVSAPAYAIFLGFPGQLRALEGETEDQFSARAEKRLAELKAAGSAEQKGQ